jgi:hypothetical protein
MDLMRMFRSFSTDKASISLSMRSSNSLISFICVPIVRISFGSELMEPGTGDGLALTAADAAA